MTKEGKEVLRKLSISYFFVHMGLLLGTWTGRIPDVKNTRQLSDAMFGLILICAILGGILSLMMTGVLAKRLGSSTTLFVGALVSVTLSPIVGITKGGLFVCILGMICIGFGLGTIDVCMYSQAVLYEKKKGTPHLGMFSATTALGTFLGAMMAGFASEAGVSPFMNFVFITFGSTPIIVLCYFNLIHKKEEDHINKIYTQQNEAMRKESVEEGSYEPEQQHACLSTFGAYCLSAKFQMGLLWMISYLSAMGDGSMSDWSTVYFVSTLGQSTRVAALSYSVYSLMMGLGRISTDYLVHALGSANVVRVSGVIAAGGLFMLVLAPYIERLFHMGLPFAVGGMFVAGWSIGVCTPIVTSMAGRVRGTDPTEAIAIVSSGQYLGMIAGPPLFGGLSGLLKGLRWSLLIDAGLVLMISAFGLFLDARLGYSTLPPLPSVDEFDRTSLVMVSVSAISPHPHERSSINSIRNSRTVSADDKLRKGQYSSMGYTAVNTEKDGE